MLIAIMIVIANCTPALPLVRVPAPARWLLQPRRCHSYTRAAGTSAVLGLGRHWHGGHRVPREGLQVSDASTPTECYLGYRRTHSGQRRGAQG